MNSGYNNNNGGRTYYANNNQGRSYNGGNFKASYKPSYTQNNNAPQKQMSGAKKCNTDSFAVSAWKKQKSAFLTFYFTTKGKFCKETKGKNGKLYTTGVVCVITNKTTMQKSYAFGIFSNETYTFTCKDMGFYITLKNGGFVGRIKK